MQETEPSVEQQYHETLEEYLRSRSEEALYRTSLLSQTLVEHGLGPEEIIALHFQALEPALARLSYREQARAIGDAHQFLLEVMIAYGVRYKEYLELRMVDSMREAEARAEAERQRAFETQRVEAEKAELLEIIAHELRTPITAALGNLDLAVRSLSRGQLDRLPTYLGSAREAIDRLSRLSADLVESSRGTVRDLEMVSVDLGEVITQACAWASPAASEKGIAFVPDAGGLMAVRGNADALLSVLGNLLANAIRYTPPSGTVSVRSGIDGSRAWFEVADSGIGMPPEVVGHIFEKFYRAPRARTSDSHGLGLGLSLVQEIVQAHGGSIEVQSESDRGSTFRVTLPLEVANPRPGSWGEGKT